MNGAHRKVKCHCGMSEVARQVYVDKVIKDLRSLFEYAPDGRKWIEHVLEKRPDLRDRLARALR